MELNQREIELLKDLIKYIVTNEEYIKLIEKIIKEGEKNETENND